MNTVQKWEWAGRMMNFAALWLPLILLFWLRLSKRKENRTWAIPILIAVTASWVAQILFRIYIAHPIFLEWAKEHEYESDGVGMNIVILVIGWVPPLILCGIVWVLWNGFDYLQKRRTAPPASPLSPDSTPWP